MERKPHKHAAVIKAWADGASVQILSSYQHQWRDCPEPMWFPGREYRVKPEPVVIERWVALYEDGSFNSIHYATEIACRTCAPMFNTTRIIKLTGTYEE